MPMSKEVGVDMTHAYTISIQRGFASLKMFISGCGAMTVSELPVLSIVKSVSGQLCKYRNNTLQVLSTDMLWSGERRL